MDIFLASQPETTEGVLLVVIGLVLLIAEAHITTFGVLGVGGAATLAIGGIMLREGGDLDIPVALIILIAALIAGFTVFAAGKVVQSRRNKVQTGWEELAGEAGEVRVELDPIGQAFIRGALWRARSSDDSTIEAGATVVVDRVDGLTVFVHRRDQ